MTGSLQVKNGMYYAVLNMRGLDGKRMQKWIPLNIQQKGGKKKAEAMLSELILQYEGINAVEAEHILLSDHLLVWAEHQKNYVTATTWQGYMDMINLHIHITQLYEFHTVELRRHLPFQQMTSSKESCHRF